MPTPNDHAVLSASGAYRWLNCTAAPRFEAQFPESASPYAAEGTLAHAICELYARKKFTALSTRKYNADLKKLQADPIYDPEMLRTAEAYVEHLTEAAMAFAATPHVALEVRVDLSEYIQEGFGTCDCVMVGGDTLRITDYKHGKGVPVDAHGNPQMRLYALGALRLYRAIYGDAIKRITMSICQPRLTREASEETISVEDLLAWGESIKPVAQKAYAGLGEFAPGEHCRFCRGKAQCRARANACTALEDFKDCAPDTLSGTEIGDLLTRGKSLVAWYKDLEDYATKAMLDGQPIEGWKLVAGRSVRAFADPDAAIAAVIAAGYDEALVYDRKPKTLAELEKLMGKAEFADKIGKYVTRPAGKPTLATAADRREAYNPAAVDFGGSV